MVRENLANLERQRFQARLDLVANANAPDPITLVNRYNALTAAINNLRSTFADLLETPIVSLNGTDDSLQTVLAKT